MCDIGEWIIEIDSTTTNQELGKMMDIFQSHFNIPQPDVQHFVHFANVVEKVEHYIKNKHDQSALLRFLHHLYSHGIDLNRFCIGTVSSLEATWFTPLAPLHPSDTWGACWVTDFTEEDSQGRKTLKSAPALFSALDTIRSIPMPESDDELSGIFN
jgi:hypothetical protein